MLDGREREFGRVIYPNWRTIACRLARPSLSPKIAMSLPPEITDLISEFGVPAGAIGVAVGLVRGARALEKDANEAALRYVSCLLIGGGIGSVGKVGPTLVPVIFDGIFGQRPISVKFFTRSVLATTLFWFLLLTAKHPNWNEIWQSTIRPATFILIPSWYILDWLSLVKARFIIKLMSQKYAIISSAIFLFIDVSVSFFLPIIFLVVLSCICQMLQIIEYYDTWGRYFFEVKIFVEGYLDLNPIFALYIFADSITKLQSVIIPSTLLTSTWVFLIFLSAIVSQLLIPLDRVRQFAAWWFRDVEKHPLTVIAKVTATMIIIGAGAIKIVHWM
jgi:hypothetical protein